MLLGFEKWDICHYHQENSNWNSCNGAINERGIFMGDQSGHMTWEEEYMLEHQVFLK